MTFDELKPFPKPDDFPGFQKITDCLPDQMVSFGRFPDVTDDFRRYNEPVSNKMKAVLPHPGGRIKIFSS